MKDRHLDAKTTVSAGELAYSMAINLLNYIRKEVVNYGGQCLVYHCFHWHVSDALFHGKRLDVTVFDIQIFHVPLAYS